MQINKKDLQNYVSLQQRSWALFDSENKLEKSFWVNRKGEFKVIFQEKIMVITDNIDYAVSLYNNLLVTKSKKS